VKYIIAIIQPDRLEEVQKELFAREINLMTVSEVMGCGRQKGITQIFRGRKESGNLLKKTKLEIAVNDNFVAPAIEAIEKGARTGNIGDGKIFVLDLVECVRLSSGETGGVAIG
jgi:nitrogen regulatory protein P-II 2